jgi:hypothetical protein
VLRTELEGSREEVQNFKRRASELEEVREWLTNFFTTIDVSPAGKLRTRVIRYIKGMPEANGVTIPSFDD